MHNLCHKPRASGVGQIYKLHIELQPLVLSRRTLAVGKKKNQSHYTFWLTLIQTKQTAVKVVFKALSRVCIVYMCLTLLPFNWSFQWFGSALSCTC